METRFCLRPRRRPVARNCLFCSGGSFLYANSASPIKALCQTSHQEAGNILGELLQVRMDNRLTTSWAARLNQTFFVKVGRTRLLLIKKEQYDASGIMVLFIPEKGKTPFLHSLSSAR